MPSPFPGMGPYLEQDDAWQDFHERFVPLAASWLGAQLRPRHIVKIDEHIYGRVLHEARRQWIGRADVSVAPGSRATKRDRAGVLEAPARVQLPAVDRERMSFVKILDRRERALVAVGCANGFWRRCDRRDACRT